MQSLLNLSVCDNVDDDETITVKCNQKHVTSRKVIATTRQQIVKLHCISNSGRTSCCYCSQNEMEDCTRMIGLMIVNFFTVKRWSRLLNTKQVFHKYMCESMGLCAMDTMSNQWLTEKTKEPLKSEPTERVSIMNSLCDIVDSLSVCLQRNVDWL